MKALMGHPLDAAFGADTLRGADPRIVVTNISQEITVKASYGENSGRDGRRKHRVRREVIRVTVAFKIWEFESVPDREAAVEAANAWARDGWLKITSKPGRRLMVQCAGRAATRNPRDYKEEYQLIFETAQSPFWEDEAPAVYTLSGTSDTQEIRVPGTYESVFDVSVAHASGTLNALTLLNDAVKKGGVMASSHVGGLSGAFIPVSEDAGMIRAAEEGVLQIDKLEAMTCVCSVGLDMIAVPGDTSAETLSAIIADEAAIGMINGKTTAVRLIPAVGKTVGDRVDFGGLLGSAPVIPLHRESAAEFIARGGRIPAPLHSLKN